MLGLAGVSASSILPMARTVEKGRPDGHVAGYAIAGGAFALSLAFRYLVRDTFGLSLPYLQFYPVVILSSWFGGTGSGLLATGASALAAMYLFLPPEGLAIGGPADGWSLAIFVATCAVIVWLNHKLRLSESAHRAAATMAEARAERLEAILNTSVDGIIVIDAAGRI